jgi:hypothetical protein
VIFASSAEAGKAASTLALKATHRKNFIACSLR